MPVPDCPFNWIQGQFQKGCQDCCAPVIKGVKFGRVAGLIGRKCPVNHVVIPAQKPLREESFFVSGECLQFKKDSSK
jgi:hypothetical protein